MKLLPGAIILMAAALFASAQQAEALSYSDSTGDLFNNSFSHLDITSVEANNNATDLIFKINLNGDPVATDWGKYMIAIDSGAGGDTSNNGWGRPISMDSGMDYWIGSWVDSGNGVELWKYTGGTWGLTNASYAYPQSLAVAKNSTSVTLTVPMASIGITVGDSFFFDIYTSGGGGTDGAVDALANPSQTIADWGDPYNSTLKYVYGIPEPTTLALVSCGGLMLIGRMFRRVLK